MPPKRVRAIVKVQIAAGQATPAPPIGPALGQHGVNIMQFVKDYNARTSSLVGSVVPAEITIFEDRSFTFITKSPPASDLLKKAAAIEKGSSDPVKRKVGSVNKDDVKKIAELKMKDLNAVDLPAAMRIVEGTARSMGVEIKEK